MSIVSVYSLTVIGNIQMGSNPRATCFADVVPVKKAGFGSGNSRPILLDNVACDGSEENISQCVYDTVNNCDHSEVAGVICGGISIVCTLVCGIYCMYVGIYV